MSNVASWWVSYDGFHCNPTHAKCFMSEHVYWILWVVGRGQIQSPRHHPHPFWWCHFLLWKERAALLLSFPLQLPFSFALMLSNMHLSFTAWTCPWGFHPLPPETFWKIQDSSSWEFCWVWSSPFPTCRRQARKVSIGWRLEGGWSLRRQASRLSEGPPSLLCSSDSS